MTRRPVIARSAPLALLAVAVLGGWPALGALGPVGGELAVNEVAAGLQTAPVVAALADRYVVVWESASDDDADRTLEARGFTAAGTPAFETIQIAAATLGDQAAPDVAALGDGFVVAWQGYDLVSESDEVVARRFGPNGFPRGAVLPVATGAGNASSPSVAGGPAGFALAWVASVGTDTDIALRRYDPAGAALGATLAPSTTSAGLQIEPDVARTPDGGLVVVWQSLGQDGSEWGVFARRYGPDGTPLDGAEWQVTAAASGSQTQPAVAVRSDGGFLVAWNDFGRDGDADGIWAQAFSAAGGKLGPERQVATRAAGRQSSPTVVAVSDGYLVAWRSSEGDGSGSGIFARQFDAAGSPLTGEVGVNAVTAGSQIVPALAGLGSEVLAVWQSDAAAGDTEIRGRRLGESTAGPCVASGTTLCLAGDRFEVRATWRTPTGASGIADVVELTADTGYLWFFAATNVEVVVKVLDGCGVNGRYWVFAGGLTDVAVELRVRDSVTGEIRTYVNPQGTAFQPLQDTSAFAGCGLPGPG